MLLERIQFKRVPTNVSYEVSPLQSSRRHDEAPARLMLGLVIDIKQCS
jgi:hypothetical protein